MPKTPRNLQACEQWYAPRIHVSTNALTMNGCISRSRKVRCDGARPRCNVCLRRSQTCQWPDRPAPGNYRFVFVDEAASKENLPRQALARDGDARPDAPPIGEGLPMSLRQRLLHIFSQTHHMLELCGCIDMEMAKSGATDKEAFLLQSVWALSSLYLTDVEAASDARFANSKSFMFSYRSKAQESSRLLSDEPSGNYFSLLPYEIWAFF